MERQRIMRAIPKSLLMSAATVFAMTCSLLLTASESTHPRDVWQSLSAAERKLPRDILVQQLQAQGRAVPHGWLRSSQARSKNVESEPEPIMYRLVGEDIDTLQTVMGLVGIQVRTVSPSRGYVVVMLTDSQVLEVANYDAVRIIQRVKGPRAQGTTDAWVAHRFGDMDGENEPSNIPGKPTLTGASVVVGVISLPVSQEDVNDLTTDGALPALYDDTAPSTDSRLYLYRGYQKDDANDPDVDLDVISASSGVDAGLNMVQVIRDIAPHAKFVLASPGLTSDPQDMANLIAALVAGRGSAGDPDYIPPADIIVDDLDYLTQNPFEVGLISEAIQAAEAAGTMHITAAGDDGYFASTGSHSNVFLETFNGISENTEFFPELQLALHRFSTGDFYLEVEQSLSDLCLFWSENPGSGDSGNDLTVIVWVDDGDNIVQESEAIYGYYGYGNAGVGPGYCLSVVETNSISIPADARILIEGSAQNTDRFILVGERANATFVDQQGVDSITATFSSTTPGAIRGHAYYDAALTAGGARYIKANTAVVPFWDTETDGGQLAGTVNANDYSSDGEINTQRFFWRQNDESQWQGLSLSDAQSAPQKPDLTAASAIGVRVVTQNSNEGTPAAVADQTFYGTSASAAVATGAAALYWEFREWQITQGVVSGPEVVAADVRRAVTASSRGNTEQWNRTLGNGVLDAPKALESPLPPRNLTLIETQPGVLRLSFDRAFNDTDANATFFYGVECSYTNNPANGDLINEDNIEPADSGEGSGNFKAPITLYPPNNLIGEEVTCTVTTTHPQAGSGWEGSGSGSATSLTNALSPPLVTMTAKSAGVTMQFDASPDDDVADLVYKAACTPDDGNTISGWPAVNGVVVPNSIESPNLYSRPVDPGVTVACTVTASHARGGNEDLTLTAQDSASASAGTPTATTITVTPDGGGVAVNWTVDPNLVTGVSAGVTLNCTQGVTQLVDQLVSGSYYFVEADQSAPVQCSITTAISGPAMTTINQGPVSGSATAEEELATGLPVWLLYVATQPQTVISDQPSVGTGSSQSEELTVNSTKSLGQSFTAVKSGQLTSITVYLKEVNSSTSAELTMEIKALPTNLTDLSTGTVLATATVANAEVPQNNELQGAVSVTFASPATLVEGQEYAFLLQTSDTQGYEIWYNSDAYTDGAALENTGGGWVEVSVGSPPAAIDFSFQVFTKYTQ